MSFVLKTIRTVLAKKGLTLARQVAYLDKQPSPELFENSADFTRIMSLHLARLEIDEFNVAGHCAEVGVFQGKFAALIHQSFPDRTLYLFDTFKGFDEKDAKVEVQANFSSAKQDFTGTSVELVLSKMKHREKCIPRQGWFPETFAGLEDERFAFVSLDTDLYAPILSGLEHFYPRLSPGGFIFVHDYRNKGYPGAMQAVREFSQAHGVPYVVLPDSCGTSVIRSPLPMIGRE